MVLPILSLDTVSSLRQLLHNNLIPPIPKRTLSLSFNHLIRDIELPRLPPLLGHGLGGFFGEHGWRYVYDSGNWGAGCDELHYFGEGLGVGRLGGLGWCGGTFWGGGVRGVCV